MADVKKVDIREATDVALTCIEAPVIVAREYPCRQKNMPGGTQEAMDLEISCTRLRAANEGGVKGDHLGVSRTRTAGSVGG